MQVPHLLLAASASGLLGTIALAAEATVPPLLYDPSLKLEAIATFPEIETPTTVAASPDGAIYIGSDPRDSRLNTKAAECTVTRLENVAPGSRRTTFATGLYSPAGSLWHEGWLYILHDPLLSRFKDTNGDGVADLREDLVTHLGPEPYEGLNDHVVSGFTLGMDGFFYISVGDKGVYHATGKDGNEATLQGGGIVRCRPDGTGLEVFSGGTRNHLEVDLDAMDRAFTLDNTDDGNGWWTRLTHHVEGGYYGYPFFYKNDLTNGLMAPGPQKAQPLPGAPAMNEHMLPAMTDFGGGSPCGGLCYMSDGLPEPYRGKLFFSEWGKRQLNVIEVKPEGATFQFVRNDALLMADKVGDFRPMQIYVAADGSLLISDWGYGGWKSPKATGTLWRLSWPDAKPEPRLADEKGASSADLVKALSHPDRNQRLRAEWELAHRGESVIPQLIALMNNISADEIARAHAVWTLDLIGESSAELRTQASGLIRQLLTSESGTLRAQAIRALGTRAQSAAASEITPHLEDPNAEVRMQAAIALGRIRSKSAYPALWKALDDPDRWVRFATKVALAKVPTGLLFNAMASEDPMLSEQAWLTATYTYDPNFVLAIQHALSPESTKPEVRRRAVAAAGELAKMPTPWDGHWWGTQPVKSHPPANNVEWAGTKPLTTLLNHTLLKDESAGMRLAAAQAMGRAIGTECLPALRSQLTIEQDSGVRRQIIETLGIQKDSEAISLFSNIALDEKASQEFRDTAILAVANIGGDEARKTMEKLAGADLSPAATLQVVRSVGEMKLLEGASAIKRYATSPDAKLRLATIKALSSLGNKADALDVYSAALQDKDGAVLNAALEAMERMHDPRVLPALLPLAEKYKKRREYITALASVSDPQTIPVMLEVLRGSDSGMRRSALSALKKMKAVARPQVEDFIAAGKIPQEYLPEIKMAFESGTITKWKLLGPFENVWGAVHPPEAEALAAGGQPDLKKKYLNAEGQEVGWRDGAASEQEGKLDLAKVFKTSGMVCSYAYAELTATEVTDAKLLTGSDDQIAVWLNGQKVHDAGGSRSFEADHDETVLHLTAGTNRLLMKIGNNGGEWVFAARIPGLDGTTFTPSKEPTPEVKQRNYALAATPEGGWVHAGDPKRGEKIFSDPTGPLSAICVTCHAVHGKGGQIGPELGNVGLNYKRGDLITSIHEPSKTIALGFDQFAVETKGGEQFVGAIRQETAEGITIVGGDGQPHVVTKGDEKSRTHLPLSLMPPGLTLGLKPEEFADLLAYLEGLKGQ